MIVGKTVACFGNGAGERGEPPYDAMMEVGRLLAKRGIEVITGGYSGSGMEAPHRGAQLAGSVANIGYTLACRDKRPNPYCNNVVVCGRDVRTEPNNEAIQYALRLGMLLQADGFVVDPTDQTPGTLIEFLSVVNMNLKFWQTNKRPIVILGLSAMRGHQFMSAAASFGSIVDMVKELDTPSATVEWLLHHMRT